MTAPRVVAGRIDQPRFHGIDVEIPHDLGEVAVLLHQAVPVSPAKERTVLAVLAIEPLRIDALKVSHRPVQATAFVVP